MHTKTQNYRSLAWKQFRKNKLALASLWLLFLLIFIALFADILANGRPLYAKYRGKTFYPAFTGNVFWGMFSGRAISDSTLNPETNNLEQLQFDVIDWRSIKLESVIWAPIPYSPQQTDIFNREYTAPAAQQRYKNPEGEIVKPPFIFRHHLGTNNIGQDIFSGLIHGTRISLTIGLVAVGIAAFIGVLLGAVSGFFGDYGVTTNRASYWLSIIGALPGIFYGFIVRNEVLANAAETGIINAFFQIILSIFILIFFIFLFGWIGKRIKRPALLAKPVHVPVDAFVSRSIEILDSLPKLLLIITIAALFTTKSLYLVMIVIGLTSWSGIARLTRAEFLRNRKLNYVEAAKALGFKQKRIIFRHALPNSLAPVFVAVAFGIASAIIAESSLSFLGIGVPEDVVSWGSMLSAGRQRFDAWWLVVFPGLAIFVTVMVFNLLGDGLRDALDPRLRE